jgi:hypothetical protein
MRRCRTRSEKKYNRSFKWTGSCSHPMPAQQPQHRVVIVGVLRQSIHPPPIHPSARPRIRLYGSRSGVLAQQLPGLCRYGSLTSLLPVVLLCRPSRPAARAGCLSPRRPGPGPARKTAHRRAPRTRSVVRRPLAPWWPLSRFHC